jgi:hypothetical protein
MPTIAQLPAAAQALSNADLIPIDQNVSDTYTTGQTNLGSLLSLLAASNLMPVSMYSGTGAPTNAVGSVNGDAYLNIQNGDLWQLASGTWTTVGSLLGPAGAPGAEGPAGPSYSITEQSTVNSVAGTDLVGISQGGSDHTITLADMLGGQTINQGTAAAPASSTDTFWVGQGGTSMVVQSIGALWPWIVGQLPTYFLPAIEFVANATLDGSIHNGKLLICSQPVTITAGGTMGSGFSCTIINVSAGTCNLSGFTTSSGSGTLSPGQSAIIYSASYSTGTVRYAMIAGGASTPPSPPGTPVGLTAGTPTASTVPLSWTAPGSGGAPASYTVQYRVTGGGSWTQVSAISGTSYGVTGLPASTEYDFQVQAVNAGGVSGWTVTTNATTAAGTAPGVPTNLAAASPTSNSVTLSWTAPSVGGVGATYQVQYQVQGAGSWAAGPATSSTSVTMTGLSASTTYNFEVETVNGGLTSAWTASVSEATTAASNYLLTAGLYPSGSFIAGQGGIPVNVDDNSTVGEGSHTAPASVSFGWSTSNTTAPATLTAAAGTSQSIPGETSRNIWYQWIGGPSTAGSYYFWAIAYNASGTQVAQYVSSATFTFL